MISQACLTNCLNKLRAQRGEAEEKIARILTTKAGIRREDFDTQGEFTNELSQCDRLKDVAFAGLRKTNIRIDELEKGTFTGDCAKCGKKIDEDDLRDNPLMCLCRGCQTAVNMHNIVNHRSIASVKH